jgi:LCP family protein required for cell wall assembly
MATHSKSYSQSAASSLIINGLITGMVFVFLLGGAYVGYVFYYTVKNAVINANLPGLDSVELSLPQVVAALPLTGNTDDTTTITLPVVRGGDDGETSSSGAPLPNYEFKERINILLLGIDKRPDEVYSRTDTMILVTVDPNTNTAGMLSIPRDLWVSIPGYDEDRINKAYFLADQNKYPGGGPALAMKTVQYNLGVPVHFYAQIDFRGFEEIIDTLGGIDIYVPETIDDPKFPDANYGYDPFYIEEGYHQLDGHDAMRYARTRATPGSDFSRAKRQQQVLLAIRDKALQIGIIPKIPELWATFSETVQTDLQLVDILELTQLADDISADDIRSEVIDFRMTVNYVVPDTGAQVLLPLREKIKVVIDEMFAETEAQPVVAAQPQEEEVPVSEATSQAQARAQEIEQVAQRQEEIRALLAQEDARLVIQNGTPVANLASQTAMFLKNQGFNIVQFSPAENDSYPKSVIVIYNEDKDYTLNLLTSVFEVADENIRRSPNLQSDVDFRVIIGSDFQLQERMETPLLSPNE